MGYRYTNTVLLLLTEGLLKDSARSAARECGVDIWDSDCATDLFGAPYFLAIVDTTQIAERDWSAFCEYLSDVRETETKVLLAQPLHHYADKLPRINAVALADEEQASLKFLMLRLRAATEKRHAIWKRAERRIVRLMWMVRELQSSRGLRLHAASREFGVSIRTVQRDLEVLMMASYRISNGSERGTYVMDAPLMDADGHGS